MTQNAQTQEQFPTGSSTLPRTVTDMDTILHVPVGAVLIPVLEAGVGAKLPGARRVEGSASVAYLTPEGSEIPLSTATVFSIGRAKANSLRLDIPDISRAHAEIQFTGGQWLLRDCGSLNGTFLNETRLHSHGERALTPGDTIRLGTTVIYMLQILPTSHQTAAMSRT